LAHKSLAINSISDWYLIAAAPAELGSNSEGEELFPLPRLKNVPK
jgi:hypothetical protein